MNIYTGWYTALFGALFIGALNTIGDVIWDSWIRSHRMFFGLLHGILLCAAMGLVLGLASGVPGAIRKGPLVSVVIGFVSAASYYLFASWLGYWAMLLSWLLLWVLLAWLERRLGSRSQTIGGTLLRGLASGLLSGLAFYAIIDIWRNPPLEPNYWYSFAAWSFAFFPGFLVLLLGRPGHERP